MRVYAAIAAAPLATVLLGVAISSQAKQVPLDGTFRMSGPSLIDPDPDEKTDRILLRFTGVTAKQIFDNMPQQPATLDCDGTIDPGMPLKKRSGGLLCKQTLNDSSYVCTVAIVLASGRAVDGVAC